MVYVGRFYVLYVLFGWVEKSDCNGFGEFFWFKVGL